MKIETSAGNLSAVLNSIAPIHQRRATIPVLQSVLFDGNTARITDLDMMAKISMPVSFSSGTAAIEFAALRELARLVDADMPVTLSRDDAGAMRFAFAGADYPLYGYPAEDFPSWESVRHNAATRTALHNAGLAAALDKIRFAISDDETRYYLHGACFSLDQAGRPVVVATNGHMLACMRLPFDIAGAEDCILPTKAVNFLVGRKAEPVQCAFDAEAKRCRFEWPGLVFESRLIDGTYPDWRRVVPGETVPYLSIDPVKWRRAIRRLAVAGRPSRYGTQLAIDPHGDKAVRLSVFHGSGTTCSEIVPAEILDDFKADEVAFNSRYLDMVLGRFGTGDVTLSARAGGMAGQPATFTSAEEGAPFVILMPLRRSVK